MLRIHQQPLAGGALVTDYLAGAPGASTFYPHEPFSIGGYADKLAETTRRFDRAARARAAAALRPTSPTAARRLSGFVEHGGAMVTTGQQAGLFTGPLYTIYKALTAVRLANALERALSVPVLPVFWVASDDHDFAEVAHTDFLTAAGEPCRIQLNRADPRPLPMSEMPLGAQVEPTLLRAAEAIEGQKYAPEVLRLLRDTYRPKRSVSDAFRDCIAALLAPFDVLVADAANPALKRAAVPVLLREASEAVERVRAVAAVSQQLEACGYATQVAVSSDASNLFHHGSAGRERLVWRDDLWTTAERGGQRFSPGELADAIEARPTSFSPGVLLRPVVESFVFPTLAYVAGPGEMAYFPQTAPLFAAEGIRMPAVYPRFSAALVPPAVDEILMRLDLPIGALSAPPQQVSQRVARANVPAPVSFALASLRESIGTAYAGLISALEDTDPAAAQYAAARRNRALLDAGDVERRILRGIKRGRDIESAVARAHAALDPHGVPQERALNLFTFVAGSGFELLTRLAAQITVPLAATPDPPAAMPDPGFAAACGRTQSGASEPLDAPQAGNEPA